MLGLRSTRGALPQEPPVCSGPHGQISGLPGFCCPVPLSAGLQPRHRFYFSVASHGFTLIPEGALVGNASLDGVGAPLSSQVLVPEAGQSTDALSERERVLKSPRPPGAHLGRCMGSACRGLWGTVLAAATQGCRLCVCSGPGGQARPCFRLLKTGLVRVETSWPP